jgi:hypothetical protein
MTRADRLSIRVCSLVADHGAWIIGLTVVAMASLQGPAWGQSAVWQPQGATTGNIYYNGGNVGIGTTSPLSALDVYGQLTLSGPSNVSRQIQPSNTSMGVLVLGGTNYTTGASLQVYGQTSPYPGHVYLVSGGVGNTTDGIIEFATRLSNGGYLPQMTILANSRVGIGTTSPQHKLSVNGTIGAKEVIVTNTGWADYVFKPGYSLKPLSAVREYIKKNHRLPDMPSEIDVRNKGANVGELQVKLLAKIEELTLHMIEADQRNSRAESQNRKLREENRLLAEQNRGIEARLKKLEANLPAHGAPASE